MYLGTLSNSCKLGYVIWTTWGVAVFPPSAEPLTWWRDAINHNLLIPEHVSLKPSNLTLSTGTWMASWRGAVVSVRSLGMLRKPEMSSTTDATCARASANRIDAHRSWWGDSDCNHGILVDNIIHVNKIQNVWPRKKTEQKLDSRRAKHPKLPWHRLGAEINRSSKQNALST